MKEALPLVEREYQTASRHIAGISMGGAGALFFVLHHPGVFESAAILSGPTLDAKGMTEVRNSWFMRTFARLGRVFGDANDEERKRRSDPFQQWHKPEDLHGLRLFIAHGDRDVLGLGQSNQHLHQHLTQAGIPHRYVVFPGGHEWPAWQPMFGELIRDALARPAAAFR
jgi:enterochelin esterase-like enzyme